MGRVYNYKRTGTRKMALIVCICATLLIILFVSTTPRLGLGTTIPLIMMAVCSGVLASSSYRKYKTKIEDDVIDIVGRKISIEYIRHIEIKDNRIDLIVEKGIFMLGTHLYMTEANFDNAQDWNDFKKDMENLKTKLVNKQ